MKKTPLIIICAIALSLMVPLILIVTRDSVTSKWGQGGWNACQFVREQYPELSEDIKSVDIIAEDSLPNDLGLSFASIRASSVKLAYYEGRTTYDEMTRVIDSCRAELLAVEQSWRYGTVSRETKKYKHLWHKVYTVRVTMKSGDTKELRVMMDNNGVTPCKLESDFMIDLIGYQSIFSYD